MKKFVAALVFSVGMVVAPALYAQSDAPAGPAGPAFQPSGKPKPAKAPRKRQASAADIARMQRRMNMNPDEVKRDKDMEVLEARSGASTISNGGRSYESSGGGFVVRRFRDKTGNATQRRGQTRPAPGIDPKGKPLKHPRPHRFLWFHYMA